MKININTMGNSLNRPLVFFHGWGFDQQVWHSTALLLQEKYHLYLVDLPGFGNSGLVGWEDFKKCLLRYLPQEFALIGWSLGGLYATRLALETDRCSHLLNIAASPCFIKKGTWPGVEPGILEKFFANIEINPQRTLQDFVELQARRKTQFVPKSLPSSSALKAGLQILATWDLREALREAQFPVAYLFGRLDSITPSSVLKAMQDAYPQFDYYLFKKSAHMPFLSQQEEFIGLLERFIQ